ncbi:hypothetical protein JOF56_011009 [Kibdelosporangium banguiense]|uniref:ADP ribosyltransferase domain-containing protein n=1 Tax=Kibdelosporangium banguiense TaxID=1365924 RepID=A0ABS4U351_9PSEU|nr:hypothetical protein [Kibdelosporangium banguiense]MBP2330624.1 hypothetical protein [Kibdelosporangium banguiense]
MCRPGGRRCPGGHSASRKAQAARQQLCRARKALARAEASNDQAAIDRARERVEDAQDTVTAERIIAGADTPDTPNQAGLYRAERQAVSGYTGGLSASINRYIQNGYQVDGYGADDKEYTREMRQTARALERAINRSTVDTPTTATRAIHAETADQVYGPVGSMVGQTVTEARCTSTTKGTTPLEGFGDVTVHYELAPGTKALDVNASGVAAKRDENELILGPHQPFHMTSDRIVNGRRVITMTNSSTPEPLRPDSAPHPGDVTRPMEPDNPTPGQQPAVPEFQQRWQQLTQQAQRNDTRDRARRQAENAVAPQNSATPDTDRTASPEKPASAPYTQRAGVWAETARNATTEHERRVAQAHADEWARIADQADQQARQPQPNLGFAVGNNTNVVTGNARVGSQHDVLNATVAITPAGITIQPINPDRAQQRAQRAAERARRASERAEQAATHADHDTGGTQAGATRNITIGNVQIQVGQHFGSVHINGRPVD